MTRRTEQLASTIRGAVQEILDRGLQDPRVSGMITVTDVRLTEDLATAFVSVSVLPADRAGLTFHGLQSAARHMRREVGKRLSLRRVPELAFRLDESFKQQAAVIEALGRVRAERESRGDPSSPPPEDPVP